MPHITYHHTVTLSTSSHHTWHATLGASSHHTWQATLSSSSHHIIGHATHAKFLNHHITLATQLRWMKYWIVYALFTFTTTYADIFLFWSAITITTVTSVTCSVHLNWNHDLIYQRCPNHTCRLPFYFSLRFAIIVFLSVFRVSDTINDPTT